MKNKQHKCKYLKDSIKLLKKKLDRKDIDFNFWETVDFENYITSLEQELFRQKNRKRIIQRKMQTAKKMYQFDF